MTASLMLASIHEDKAVIRELKNKVVAVHHINAIKLSVKSLIWIKIVAYFVVPPPLRKRGKTGV